ncbi:hypothetical protein DERF_002044 [Dermatophagoides farinae]|uniref:Uncharacterized protein n=1 Tax=Dermatophagoides farinae TaxID=6954 RepID=A0A922LD68_DERFA|nr:hypothetical protein DERF_002044 [Dermatophagoides farinae]
MIIIFCMDLDHSFPITSDHMIFQSSSSIIDTLILLNHGNQISPYTIEIGKLNEEKKKENDKTDKIFSPRSSSLDEAIITYKK